MAYALRFDETLGGESVTIPGGGQLAREIIRYAEANNFTHLVIGKSARSPVGRKNFRVGDRGAGAHRATSPCT